MTSTTARSRAQRRHRAFGLALALALVAGLAAAPRAHAGAYVVSQCSSLEPGPGQASWERSSSAYEQRSRCASGEGLQVFHRGATSGLWHFGGWVWRAPAGTVFTNVQANASLAYQAGHRGQLVATTTTGVPVEFGTEHDDFRVHSVGGEFSQFHAWLRCIAPGAGRPCGRAGEDSAHAYVRGVFLSTADRAAPTVSIGGGSLLADPVVRGNRELSFTAADRGGGVRRIQVEANGQTLATDVRNCLLAEGYATALTPCPPSTTESALVPTTGPAFTTGPNLVAACAEDLALDGPPNRTCEQRRVWVDNLCPASPVDGGTALEAGFAGGAPQVRVRSDRGGVIHGRLVGAGAGATVCALTRVQLDGSPIVVGAVATTGAGGDYAIDLPPGASREVFVHHVVGDRVAARHGLTLRSRARPSLAVAPRRAVHRRERLRFSGTLPGPSCYDRVVKVQARLGKRRWQVFRTDRADESCRFEARYKLRSTRTARRYRFRALVPRQAGYPFERGRSKVFKVRVKRRRG